MKKMEKINNNILNTQNSFDNYNCSNKPIKSLNNYISNSSLKEIEMNLFKNKVKKLKINYNNKSNNKITYTTYMKYFLPTQSLLKVNQKEKPNTINKKKILINNIKNNSSLSSSKVNVLSMNSSNNTSKNKNKRKKTNKYNCRNKAINNSQMNSHKNKNNLTTESIISTNIKMNNKTNKNISKNINYSYNKKDFFKTIQKTNKNTKKYLPIKNNFYLISNNKMKNMNNITKEYTKTTPNTSLKDKLNERPFKNLNRLLKIPLLKYSNSSNSSFDKNKYKTSKASPRNLISLNKKNSNNNFKYTFMNKLSYNISNSKKSNIYNFKKIKQSNGNLELKLDNNLFRKKEKIFHKINTDIKKANNSKKDNFSKSKEISFTQKSNKNKFKENKLDKNIINNNFQINIKNIDYINYNLSLNEMVNLLEKKNSENKKQDNCHKETIKFKKIDKFQIKNYRRKAKMFLTREHTQNNLLNKKKILQKRLLNSMKILCNPMSKLKVKRFSNNKRKLLGKSNIKLFPYKDKKLLDKRNKSKNITKKNSFNLNNYFSLSNISNKEVDEYKKIKNTIILDSINISTYSSGKKKDSNYYLKKSEKLSQYIKEYYLKYKKYPPTDISFYLYGRLIGQGAFGKVNLGLNVLTGRVVAIKSFNKKNLDKNKKDFNRILYETNLMKKLDHPNVTKIFETFENDRYFLISMEYINGGNLFSFVKKRRKISEKISKYLFRQIILGLNHIHSHNIVHRDIKLENILIDFKNNIKICDFGIGTILKSTDDLLYEQWGTPIYMSPEVLLSNRKNNNGYKGFPVDIWACGIALYIMLSGTFPFMTDNKGSEISSFNDKSNKPEDYYNKEIKFAIINNEPNEIENISTDAKDLLNGILNKDPNKRFTIEQILCHPWLNSSNKNKNLNLFTQAEKILMSKTYVDYRKEASDELKESFSLSNLNFDFNEEDKKSDDLILKNDSSKSSILTPYNTIIDNGRSSENNHYEKTIQKKMDLNDITNEKIKLKNNLIIFTNKIKEYNLNYEINNNIDFDNGFIINTKNSLKINNSLESQKIEKDYDDDSIESIYEVNDYINDENKRKNFEIKKNKILNQIEKLGYKKDYVKYCISNKILCHSSTVYYLMMNYENI